MRLAHISAKRLGCWSFLASTPRIHLASSASAPEAEVATAYTNLYAAALAAYIAQCMPKPRSLEVILRCPEHTSCAEPLQGFDSSLGIEGPSYAESDIAALRDALRA